MKAWTSLKLMCLFTVALFLYSFLQPVFHPTEFTDVFHINPLAFGFGIISLIMNIKRYRRIKSHYKHLEFNTFDSNCRDCRSKEVSGT